MGKKNFDKSDDHPKNDNSTITHFSHPHPLNLINTNNNQQILTKLTRCAGCNLKPSGSIYTCTACSFFLHRKCSEMPRILRHPSHEDHAITLLAKPAYPNGVFCCDACHETTGGFSYHCKPCGMDLHILCAVMPLSITHASHNHELKLAYGCPYYTKSFGCDICRSDGSNHWLYRCDPCGFDAHLKCATGNFRPKPPNHANNFSDMFSGSSVPPQVNQSLFGSQFTNPQNPMLNNPGMNFNQLFGVPTSGSNVKPPQNFTSYSQYLQQIMDQNRHNMTTTQGQNTMAYLQGLQQIIDQNKQGMMSQGTQGTNDTMAYLQGLQQIIDQGTQGTPSSAGGTNLGGGSNELGVQQFLHNYLNSLNINNDNNSNGFGGDISGLNGPFGGDTGGT